MGAHYRRGLGMRIPYCQWDGKLANRKAEYVVRAVHATGEVHEFDACAVHARPLASTVGRAGWRVDIRPFSPDGIDRPTVVVAWNGETADGFDWEAEADRAIAETIDALERGW